MSELAAGLLLGAALLGGAWLARDRYPWAWAAVAVVLGAAAGWLVLGRRRADPRPAEVERLIEDGEASAEAVRREATVVQEERAAEVTGALAAPSPADAVAEMHERRRR